MANRIRELSSQCPIHVFARSNNREHFPIPLSEVWKIFEDYLFLLSSGFSIEIISFLLMPNHFHMIVQDPNLNLPLGMNHFMRDSAKEINRFAGRVNRLWSGPYGSSIITSLPYYYTCYRYIYRNPVVAGLAKSPLDYEFSSLPLLLGKGKLSFPLAEDLTLFSSVEKTIDWLEDSYEDQYRDQIRKSLKHKVMAFSADRQTRKVYEPNLPHFL